MDRVDWHRVLDFVVVPLLLYVVLAALTDAAKLNPTAYLVLMSVSTGVCVAFLPNVRRFFRAGRDLDVEDVICLGVFYSMLTNVYRPAIFTLIAMFPRLSWLRDSDVLSLGIIWAIYAGVLHLGAPIVADKLFPSRRWAWIGTLVGVGFMLGLLVVNWPEISRLWEERLPHTAASPLHDVGPGP